MPNYGDRHTGPSEEGRLLERSNIIERINKPTAFSQKFETIIKSIYSPKTLDETRIAMGEAAGTYFLEGVRQAVGPAGRNTVVEKNGVSALAVEVNGIKVHNFQSLEELIKKPGAVVRVDGIKDVAVETVAGVYRGLRAVGITDEEIVNTLNTGNDREIKQKLLGGKRVFFGVEKYLGELFGVGSTPKMENGNPQGEVASKVDPEHPRSYNLRDYVKGVSGGRVDKNSSGNDIIW